MYNVFNNKRRLDIFFKLIVNWKSAEENELLRCIVKTHVCDFKYFYQERWGTFCFFSEAPGERSGMVRVAEFLFFLLSFVYFCVSFSFYFVFCHAMSESSRLMI